MKLPTIIQGGMGVAISNWKLAKAVSSQKHLGVVSGTGMALIMIARLRDGDKDGTMRRALAHFPFPETARRIVERYHRPGQGPSLPHYPRPEMWSLTPSRHLSALTVAANFAEVFLAKEGHLHPVGINLLEKVQLPNTASLYGAMLAGVSYVLMGAGIPMQIPGIMERLADHHAASYKLDVQGATRDDDYRLQFDPQVVFPGIAETTGPLKIPRFLPIISSVALAKTLIKRTGGRLNGFIIEGPTAGGHNAPPRDQSQRDEQGQPIYGKKDAVDLEKIKALGLPFWLAGGYDTPEKLDEALALGATGVQVGTAFAFCRESGLDASLKQRVYQKVLEHRSAVNTNPLVSSTGFPFKTVLLEGTMSDAELSRERARLCDIGMLRQLYKQDDGTVGFRCPSEPEGPYLAKGGQLQDTVGKACLCNTLCASAGFPQRRKDGYIEPPLVTAGDGLPAIGRFTHDEPGSYGARDVLEYLTAKVLL